MTLEQRGKLYHILGMIEGLTWGVEDPHINEGFCDVAEALNALLEENAKPEPSADEFIMRFVDENTGLDGACEGAG